MKDRPKPLPEGLADSGAMDAAQQFFNRLASIEARLGMRTAEPLAPKVGAIIGDYSAYKQPKCRGKGWEVTRCRLVAADRHLGDVIVTDLNYEAADRFIADRIAAGVSRGTAGQDLQMLSSAINWAVKRGKVPYNPLAGYEYDLQHGTRERLFTDAEIDRLIDAAKRIECQQVVAVIEIMRWSGVRPREILKSRRESLDFKTGLLTVTADVAKTGVERFSALMPRAVEAIRSLPVSEWLIPAWTSPKKPQPYSSFNYKWNDTVDVAGIAPNKDGSRAICYGLRHTLATRLALEYGFSAFELMSHMGWSDISMAKRYVKPGATHALAMATRLQSLKRDTR